jgi:hypothetical protein
MHCDCQTYGCEKEESWTKFTESLGSTTPTSKVWQAIKSISGKQGSTNFPIGNKHTTSEEIAALFLDQFTHSCVSAKDHGADKEVINSVESVVSHAGTPQCPDISFHELQRGIQSSRNASLGDDLIANTFLTRSPDYMFGLLSLIQPVSKLSFSTYLTLALWNCASCMEKGSYLPNTKAREESSSDQILLTHIFAVLHRKTHGENHSEKN